MSINTIRHLSTLSSSPFIMEPILHEFYSNLGYKHKSLLLSYLVLPLVLYPASKKYLQRTNINSRIVHLSDRRDCILGLEQRLNFFYNTTNIMIHNSLNCNTLSMTEDLSLIYNHSDLNHRPKNLRDELRASKGLANILKPLTIPVIYKHLGINQL